MNIDPSAVVKLILIILVICIFISYILIWVYTFIGYKCDEQKNNNCAKQNLKRIEILLIASLILVIISMCVYFLGDNRELF